MAVIDAGYDVYVLANFSDNNIYEKLTRLGFKCVDSKTEEHSLNPFLFIFNVFYCFKQLNKINPDIVHSITIKPGIMSCIWVKMKNKKLVYSFVGLGRVFESSNLFYRMMKCFIKVMYRYFFLSTNCRVLFEHKQDQEKIMSLMKIPKSKTDVIDGAGINTDYFSYKNEPRLYKVKVLFASRMLWSKGLGTLIKAKQILQQKGVTFDLLVAGIIVDNDRDAISISQIESWHNSGDIEWLGKRNDIREIIEGVNIVALPSVYSEGIPRILLEAGAIGRSVISFDSGGCGSLIIDGYNGYLVPKNNIEEFAVKLSNLINNQHVREFMGVNARRLIEEKYSSELVIKKTVTIYEAF